MNTERYLAILDRIKKDPSCHKQDWWHCGTAHCFAGHAQIDSGLPINDTTCATDASDWLGISPAFAVWLFASNRTVADFEAFYSWTDAQRCLAAVQQGGYAIQYLTDAQRTPEVCLAAVQQGGYAIQCLTDVQRTPEVCLAAVQQNGHAIQYLTDAQRKSIGR